MTTNVICRPFKLVASDSRWSTPIPGHPHCLAYIDDVPFDKIAYRPTHALVFAGDGELISQWKAWFSAPGLDFAQMPKPHRLVPGTNQMESIVVSLVRRASCEVMFTVGRFVAHGEDARFAGSGAEFAKDCYAVNKCGKKSVTSAKDRDPATGGDIKFLELATGANNLNLLQASFTELLSAINQRGFVMDTNTNTVTTISEWRAGLPSAGQVAPTAALTTISAPTGLPTRCWSDEEQEEFRRALEEVAREEANFMQSQA